MTTPLQMEWEESRKKKPGDSLTPLQQEFEQSQRFADVQGGSSSTGDRSATMRAVFAPRHIDVPDPDPEPLTDVAAIQRRLAGKPRLSERIADATQSPMLATAADWTENIARGIPGGAAALVTGAARGPEMLGTIVEAVNPFTSSENRTEMARRLFPSTAEKQGTPAQHRIGEGYGPEEVDRAIQERLQPEEPGGIIGQQAGMLLAGGAVARGFRAIETRGARPPSAPPVVEQAAAGLSDLKPAETTPLQAEFEASQSSMAGLADALQKPEPIPESYPGSDLRPSDIEGLNKRMADRRAGVLPPALDEGLSPLRRRSGDVADLGPMTEAQRAHAASKVKTPLQQEYEAQVEAGVPHDQAAVQEGIFGERTLTGQPQTEMLPADAGKPVARMASTKMQPEDMARIRTGAEPPGQRPAPFDFGEEQPPEPGAGVTPVRLERMKGLKDDALMDQHRYAQRELDRKNAEFERSSNAGLSKPKMKQKQFDIRRATKALNVRLIRIEQEMERRGLDMEAMAERDAIGTEASAPRGRINSPDVPFTRAGIGGNERGALGAPKPKPLPERTVEEHAAALRESGNPVAAQNLENFMAGSQVRKPVFHGTARPDRIGTTFRKNRATSGPMAFFTDDPEIASNYAKNKRDTSLDYEGDQSYASWYKFKGKGERTPVSIDRAWYRLAPEERARVAELAPSISRTDEGAIVAEPGNKSGIGGYDYHLKEAKGNHLQALVTEWLESGALYNEEDAFSQVLQKAGVPMERITFDNPNAVKSSVYPAYLRITNPLDTGNIPSHVVDALRETAARSRKRTALAGSDIWDKNTRNVKEWVQQLQAGDEYVWTSIPDQITETLQRLGYDGIKDVGGKGGGQKHVVWVPFNETQVKSVTGNSGKFDPTVRNISGKGALPLMAGMASAIAGGAAGYASGDPNDSKGKKLLRAGLGAVGAGIVGAAVGRGFEKVGETGDAFRKLLAPASRTNESELAGNIIRAHTGQAARDFERAREALHGFRKEVRPITDPAGLSFVDAIETGSPQGSPKLTRAAGEIRRVLDTERDAIRSLGKGALDHFIADYFPHIWEDPKQVGKVIQQIESKRPLQGSKAFLKQRTIPTIAEGLKHGLTPVTDNPLDLTLLKLREMRRFRMAHEIMGEMESKGLAKTVAYDAKPPDGYARINDAIARKGGAGQVWAPEPVATVLNNYLSPGLRGNAIFDGYMNVGNVLNQAQLGLSLFHLGFTSMDAMVSKTALAVEQAAAGRPIQAAKSLATMPTAPLSNYLRGSKLMKAYLIPGSQGAEFAALADAVTQGGGRVRMEGVYKNNAITKLVQAVRRHEFGKAGIHLIPAALEAASKPLMEHIVPRQKLGVFADLARFELSKLKPGHTADEARAVMSKVWDSVDNRMGQLVYDNLFWHRALKDLSMASVRSVGWNLGTIRELGGGLKDIPKLARGKLTHRAAYVAALPITVGMAGAITQYLYTGTWPQTLKDYFFPQNGQTDDTGNPDRVVLPSYMKDVVAYADHPVMTVEHKMHPLIGLVADMLHNEDYYGDLIRNPDDPMVQQMQQEASYLAKAVLPFGVQNIIEERKRDGAVSVAPMLGVTPAPRHEVRSAAQNRMNEYVKRRLPGGRTPQTKATGDTRTTIYQKVGRGELEPRQAIDQLVATGMDRSTAASQVHQHRNIPALVRKFKALTLDEAERVYQDGTPEEQNLWLPTLNRKRREGRRHGVTP